MTWIHLISTWNRRDSVPKIDGFSSYTSTPRGFDKPFLTVDVADDWTATATLLLLPWLRWFLLLLLKETTVTTAYVLGISGILTGLERI